MTISLTLPQLKSKSLSTKDLIISVLGAKWPLSTKEIYNLVIKQHSSEISYQAVHKMLKELERDGVVVAVGRNYELNRSWISVMKNFTNRLDEAYSNTQGKFEINPDFKGPIKMNFDNVNTFMVTIGELLVKKVLMGPKHYDMVALVEHNWWPMEFKFHDLQLLKNVAKTNSPWILSRKDSPFDRWIQKQYLQNGFNGSIVGVDFKADEDILIQGESIIQASYSDEARKAMDEIYERISGISGLFNEYVRKTLAKKEIKVDVTITRNPKLADMLRNQLLAHFKEESK